MNQLRNNTGEPTKTVTLRLSKRADTALRTAMSAMKYPPTMSVMMDRAIDLLVADLKKKGEIK